MNPHSALDAATAAWAQAIGSAFVLTECEVLREWETATFATTQRVLAVVRPGSTNEVATCLRIANQYRVPVYPISRGRNWGLGSRVPVTDAAILDLGRMNRICAFDETHGTLTLEPGASFADVHAFLAERKSAWFLPVIGGPEQASVLGNALERGDLSGPLGDGPQRLTALEVVLPQGEVVHTGSARLGATPLDPLSSTPAGPSIDGLFVQANLGVVTRATVWLSRRPQCLQIVQATIPTGGFAAFVDALRPLIGQIGGQASFSLWNGAKIQARAPGKQASTATTARAWYCTGALYAPSTAMAAAQRELVVQALNDVSAPLTIDDEGSTPDLRVRAGLFLGVPSDDNVRSLYAARPGPLPADFPDPDRHGCGALWLCPELPFDGAAVARAVETCTGTLEACGLLPILAVHVHTPRVLRMFVSIFYDREQPDADAQALACHDALLAALAAQGLYPFRLGIHSMQVAQQAQTPFWEMLARIKAELDPNQILAPGRYGRRGIREQDPDKA